MTELQAHLLDAVRHAPSFMNAQPWRASFGENEMTLMATPQRMLLTAPLDEGGRSHFISMGCAAENVLLTLEQVGFDGDCWFDGFAFFSWRPRPVPPPDPRRYRMIPLRRTSRLPFGPAEPIPAQGVLWLPDQRPAVRRQMLEDLADPYAESLYRLKRFTPSHPGWHRDGLNADALGMRRWEARVVSWLTHPLVPAWIRRFLLDDVPPAPLWGLLLAHSQTLAGWFSAGRRLQGLWLEATALGLSLHPVRAAVEPPGCLLFRMGTSPPVPASPRLPVDELLE
jgi:hypothetical protein